MLALTAALGRRVRPARRCSAPTATCASRRTRRRTRTTRAPSSRSVRATGLVRRDRLTGRPRRRRLLPRGRPGPGRASAPPSTPSTPAQELERIVAAAAGATASRSAASGSRPPRAASRRTTRGSTCCATSPVSPGRSYGFENLDTPDLGGRVRDRHLAPPAPPGRVGPRPPRPPRLTGPVSLLRHRARGQTSRPRRIASRSATYADIDLCPRVAESEVATPACAPSPASARSPSGPTSRPARPRLVHAVGRDQVGVGEEAVLEHGPRRCRCWRRRGRWRRSHGW